jgi:hypothetical protein
LTLVDRIESVDMERKIVRVRRKLEGRHEIVEAPLPALITVVREINNPRYPTVPRRLLAQIPDQRRPRGPGHPEYSRPVPGRTAIHPSGNHDHFFGGV